MLPEIWVVSFVASRVLALGSGFALVFSLVHAGRHRFTQSLERMRPKWGDLHKNQKACNQNGEIDTNIRKHGAKMKAI